MADREWTILLLRDDRSGVQQYRLTRSALPLVIAGLLSFAVLISLLTLLAVRFEVPLEQSRLAHQNAELESQLYDLRSQVALLGGRLSDLWRSDAHFRLVAGLVPLDAAVQKAGIGGPDGETLERNRLWQVDAASGERVFAARAELGTLLRRARLLTASWAEARDSLSSKHALLAATPSITPTTGFISSAFSGQRWHPILDRPRPHQGLDIAARHGAPILAAARGHVSFVGDRDEYGLMIEVSHGFGYVTRYAHASMALVQVGQPVERGVPIAQVGDTGLAIGSHLHYEVLHYGKPVDPRRFLLNLSVVPD